MFSNPAASISQRSQYKTVRSKQKPRIRPYIVQRLRDCDVLPEYKRNIGHMMRYLYHTRGLESRYDYTEASKSSADYKATRCVYCHEPYVQPIQHTSCKTLMCFDCAKINAFQCIQCCCNSGNLCYTEEYFMNQGGGNSAEWDLKYQSDQLTEQLNGLEIHCQNKLYFGCEWVGTRGEYDKHRLICCATPSTCVQCKQVVLAQDKRLHYQKCRAERISCLYCGKQGNKRWVLRHQSDCSRCFEVANCLMKPEIFEPVFSVVRKQLGEFFVTRREMGAYVHQQQQQCSQLQQQIRQLQTDLDAAKTEGLAIINEKMKKLQTVNTRKRKRTDGCTRLH